MKSVHIHGWSELQQYGINYLTGEADPYSMRVLCDLSQKGAEFMCDFLGLPASRPMTEIFAPNWNSNVGEDKSVASIMMPRGLYNDLCKYILLAVEHVEFALKQPDGGWVGYSALTEALRVDIARLGGQKDWELHRNYNAASTSTRNQHAFTGRTL